MTSITPSRPMPLNPDGTLPISATAVAGHLEETITNRWRASYSRQYGDLQGFWVGGRCSADTRLEAMTTLADLAVGDLHPGLQVHLDTDDDGRPTALLVSNPRTTMEIPCRLSPRAFRIGAAVVALESPDAGRRVLEAVCCAIAAVVGSSADRRKGRRHDS